MVNKESGAKGEGALVRELGIARRPSSAKERLARLQRETKLPPGAMIRPPGKPTSSKGSR